MLSSANTQSLGGKTTGIQRQIVVIAAAMVFTGLGAASADRSKPERISPAEAVDYIGEYKSVCGWVASAKYARKSRGKPTFLNLDEPCPNQVFTAVIWRAARERFRYRPERKLLRKRICVTGTINAYRGQAEIVVESPRQIRIQK